MKSEELNEPVVIRLKPWGRVEGRLDANRKAVENQIWLYMFPNVTWYECQFDWRYETRCDGKGNFSFDKVPAGWSEAGYLTTTGNRRSPRYSPTSRKPVEVFAGKTANIILGGEGCPVVGNLCLLSGIKSRFLLKAEYGHYLLLGRKFHILIIINK